MADALGLPCSDLITAGVDVRDAAACHAVVHQVLAHWGRLDVLVNNAGIYKARPFLEYEPNDFRDLFEVNLMGTVHLTQAALKAMLAKQSGRIINIASSAGKAGSRNQSAYNVSKHAVVGLTRCLALETATQGVTVNAICPGLTQTDMVDTLNASFANAAGVTAEQMLQSILTRVPMNRLLNVGEIAGMAVYLGSEESSGMTGQAISIDGGMLTA
jgi:NAD(P)-dependent dehydrogenase (short-subunit alcohol dehydrogenase family)